MKKKAVDSKSFVQNVFRGMVVPDQAFPYPQPLDEEQKENLQMLVPIAERVMAEQNDPLVNDAQEAVPEATVQALRELGAFGLQVILTRDLLCCQCQIFPGRFPWNLTVSVSPTPSTHV